MRKLIIIGAGGHGKVVADAAEKSDKYSEIAFLDDNKVYGKVLGFDVIDKISNVRLYKDKYEFIVGIGDNNLRFKMQTMLEKENYMIATIVHPHSVIGKQVMIGRGTVIMAGAIINTETSIGKGCIINTSASIDHDCLINNYVHISPNVSVAGSVNIGYYSWIGIGSTISNNIIIGDNIVIGSGSNVINDVSEKGVYVGNPINKLEDVK